MENRWIMESQNWLNKLEERAKRLDENKWSTSASVAFAFAISPAEGTIKLLISMIRHMADGCDCDAESCIHGCTPECRIERAYQQARAETVLKVTKEGEK